MKVFLLAAGIIPVAILVIVGILIKYKKAYWLISGYNTMSAEKKKNVDVEGLGRLAGNLCFVVAVMILVAFTLIFVGLAAFSLIVFALLIPVIIYSLVKAQKYDGNARDERGRMKTGTKAAIGAVSGFLILVAIGVGVMLYFSSKPAEYSVENGVLRISGMYGQEIRINEISSLRLEEDIPDIITKTNGSDLGNMKKGYFRLLGAGSAKLFVDVSKKPFIFINRGPGLIIINCEDNEKTKALYKKLNSEWQRITGGQ